MHQIKSSESMKNLRIERKLRGWSQAGLAEALGVSARTVSCWEMGLALPQLNYRKRLGILLGMTIQEVDLLWDVHENKAVPKRLRSLAPLATADVLAQESLLADPAIPQTLDSISSLLGRTALLRQVKQRLFEADRPSFTLLRGLPGSGKTTLVEALANDQEVQARFRDGILWAALGPQPHVLGQLTRWGTLLGVAPTDLENPQSCEVWGQALQSAIGTRQILLVIDDVCTAEDALALRIGGPQCTYLLTTRQPQATLPFAKQEVIIVPQLEEADGLVLLARFVPHLVQQDPESALSLVQALGSLPLALTLMGNALVSSTSIRHPWPLRVALAQLYDTGQHLRLNMLAAPGRSSLSLAKIVPLCLYAAIAFSDQQLSPQAQAALRALAIFPPKPSSFSEQAALEISREPIETLDALWDAGLLESWGPRRYTLHQTVVDYARAKRVKFRQHDGDWSAL